MNHRNRKTMGTLMRTRQKNAAQILYTQVSSKLASFYDFIIRVIEHCIYMYVDCICTEMKIFFFHNCVSLS